MDGAGPSVKFTRSWHEVHLIVPCYQWSFPNLINVCDKVVVMMMAHKLHCNALYLQQESKVTNTKSKNFSLLYKCNCENETRKSFYIYSV